MNTALPHCFLFWCAASTVAAQTGVLDLTRLENYANQPVPAYILRDNTPQGPNPPANPITNLGATL
ncbi:MAG: hypothetical protein LDL31_08900, partial [Prosthecobacter sp.]|nr:hypothetical protein [Prosthecobacter sp.]